MMAKGKELRDRDRQAGVGHLEIGGTSKREEAALKIMLCLLDRMSDEGVKFRDGSPKRSFDEWKGTMNGSGKSFRHGRGRPLRLA